MKCEEDYIFDEKIGLNSNIRCIEMLKFEECMTFKEKLNSNIRCIEIYMHELQDRVRNGWIVTLDVLKCWSIICSKCGCNVE